MVVERCVIISSALAAERTLGGRQKAGRDTVPALPMSHPTQATYQRLMSFGSLHQHLITPIAAVFCSATGDRRRLLGQSSPVMCLSLSVTERVQKIILVVTFQIHEIKDMEQPLYASNLQLEKRCWMLVGHHP